MPQYMLDTNICIYVLKNRPGKLRDQFNQLAEQLCISTITLAELFFGTEKSSRPSENRLAVEQFSARLEVLSFSAAAASHYGQIRAALEGAGRPIGAYDMLIGAHARSAGMVIVTNNLREFERIPGLRTENWV